MRTPKMNIVFPRSRIFFCALILVWALLCVPVGKIFAQTLTPTPSGCVTVGTSDPTPATTIGISAVPNIYVANVYPIGASCGITFNQVNAYLMNGDSNPTSVQVGVYDNTALVATAWINIPPQIQGWWTVPISPIVFSCGDSVILALQTSGVFVAAGVQSLNNNCNTESGTMTGPMPATYPDPGFLTTPNPGYCYEVNLTNCSSPPTATRTVSGTPTKTGT